MKKAHAGLLALALVTFGVSAFADPPAAAATPTPAVSASSSAAAKPAPSASAYTAPDVTIHGRLDKPNVLIELQRPTAAAAARDAHEQMRIVWLKKIEPGARTR
jgi:hypothetical protein